MMEQWRDRMTKAGTIAGVGDSKIERQQDSFAVELLSVRRYDSAVGSGKLNDGENGEIGVNGELHSTEIVLQGDFDGMFHKVEMAVLTFVFVCDIILTRFGSEV